MKPSLTADQVAVQLTRVIDTIIPGWIPDFGTAFTMSYAYRASAMDGQRPNGAYPLPPSETRSFAPFNQAQIENAEEVLRLYADVANITFVRHGTGTSGPAAYSNDGIFLLGNFTEGNAINYYKRGVGGFFAVPKYSFVFLNGTTPSNLAPTYDNDGFATLIHEIGHGIGLSHPGNYDASQGVITYETHAEYAEDSDQYTVMGYFDETVTGANFGTLEAMTPLIHDIAALQHLYGANNATRSGDTTYGFNSNSGRSQLSMTAASDQRVFAIWDGGGTDMLDLSGYAQASTIDLAPGGFSSAGGLVKNISIALGATIENARGGAGGDDIAGNGAANRLVGGEGGDQLRGRAGNDVLTGEAGDDLAMGEAGDDSIVGGDGADFLFGNTNLDNLASGNDTLRGEGGVDLVLGGDGDDQVAGGDGDDEINGNTGSDSVAGGEGADFARGGQDNDIVHGEEGDDWHVNGNAGDDSVFGDGGADMVFGGLANDFLSGGAGADQLNGNLGNDTLSGGADQDMFVFSAGNGADLVEDFAAGEKIAVDLTDGAINGIAIASAVALAGRVTAAGGGSFLDLGAGNGVTIAAVAPAALGADVFLLV